MKFAVIAPMAGRHENTFPLMSAVLLSSRAPDEFWVLTETKEDYENALAAVEQMVEMDVFHRRPRQLFIEHVPTPRESGTWDVIPYSNKINYALDRSHADLFCYLDNGSRPDPRKYQYLYETCLKFPGHGSYCSQHQTGFREETRLATQPIYDGHGKVNFTQVMHPRTENRWVLDMKWANPDFADALFWRQLHNDGIVLYPVETQAVLDFHHMPSPAANI